MAAFSETPSRYLLEVRHEDLPAVKAALAAAGIPRAVVAVLDDSGKLDLSERLLDPIPVEKLAQAVTEQKAAIRAAEAAIEQAEIEIKQVLGQAEKGRAGRYLISWPMRNYKAQPEKLVPAKEAYSVRQSSLSIKEVQE